MIATGKIDGNFYNADDRDMSFAFIQWDMFWWTCLIRSSEKTWFDNSTVMKVQVQNVCFLRLLNLEMEHFS